MKHIFETAAGHAEEQALLALAGSKSELIRSLLRREAGELLEAWGALRQKLGAAEVTSLVASALEPALDGLTDLVALQNSDVERVLRLASGARTLGIAPQELAGYLASKEVDRG